MIGKDVQIYIQMLKYTYKLVHVEPVNYLNSIICLLSDETTRTISVAKGGKGKLYYNFLRDNKSCIYQMAISHFNYGYYTNEILKRIQIN